jgi:hypothetical protein
MRHQTPPEQITRLFVQKPAAFAELDENARIALSVLHDDGWSVQRIGLEVNVVVTATPIERPGTEDALAQAQAKFILLREEFEKQQAQPWLAAGGAFVVCGGLDLAGLGAWAFALAAPCVGGWVWMNRRRTNGAA